jgi:Flp pilus assembly pilin Flp
VKKYISDETGAVTIEWVVLTAGVIALGIAGYSAFKIDMD